MDKRLTTMMLKIQQIEKSLSANAPTVGAQAGTDKSAKEKLSR